MIDHSTNIIRLYEQNAHQWDRDRGKTVIEKPWLDRFLDLQPKNPEILDLGCGAAEPIARHLVENGCSVTGIDSATGMIDLCQKRLPDQTWIVSDMRDLALYRKFTGIIAWNSFFHLPHDDQRKMFSVFSKHAMQGAALLFTSGTEHGVSIGEYQNTPLYHASLDGAEYRQLLERHDFDVISHVTEDPDCGMQTVWLAQYRV